MSEHQDRLFFRNFSLTLVALTIFGLFAATMGRQLSTFAQKDDNAESVSKNVEPVGRVYTADNPPPKVVNVLADAAATGAATGDIGKHTYDTVCAACHGAGIAGAPKFGDKDLWAPRIAKGVDTLHKHALEGFNGEAGAMPAKGGQPGLSDDAVKAAVDYMLSESGGPARPAPAAEAAPAAAPAATEAAPAASAAAAPAASAEAAAPAPATADAGAKGKSTYESVCAMCHAVGVAGAPKFSNKDDWAPRIAQGVDTLHQHALKGFMGKGGMMPPKGGRADLPDEDIMAAVDYMVGAAK